MRTRANFPTPPSATFSTATAHARGRPKTVSTNLLKQAAANSINQGREESAHEQAKIGAAAERKRQDESADSYAALIESGESNGKAIRWQRRISTSDGTRNVAMFERMGAYGDREFLRLANRAAAASVPGGWKNGEAVEAIAAEIVSRVLAKTYGRMPKRGSLGQTAQSDDPDFSYLTSVGRFCVASAFRGDDAGLAAEVAPMAAAEGATTVGLAELAAESLRAAESDPEPDRYVAEPISLLPSFSGPAILPSGDYIGADQAKAVKRFAGWVGERPKAVAAAILSAMRPEVQAAQWAEAGYASSAGAFRKAACVGRKLVAERFSAIPSDPDQWSERDQDLVAAMALLTEVETVEREGKHLLEGAPTSYKAPKLPDYLPSTRVDVEDQQWNSPADLLSYPSSALKSRA